MNSLTSVCAASSTADHQHHIDSTPRHTPVITSASTEIVYTSHQPRQTSATLTSFSVPTAHQLQTDGNNHSSSTSSRDTTPTGFLAQSNHPQTLMRQQQRQDSQSTLTPQLVTQASQQWQTSPVYSLADKPPLPHGLSSNPRMAYGSTLSPMTQQQLNNNGHERTDSANFSLTSSESGGHNANQQHRSNYVQ